MKHFKQQSISLLTLVALAVPALPAHAESTPQEVQWGVICSKTQDKELTVISTTGDAVHGSCYSVGVDELRVQTKDHGVVTVARNALTRIEVHTKSDNLKTLGKDMHKSLHFGVKSLFSELALVGIVVVPVILAWGAFSAPFCALGDLGAKMKGGKEIKPI
jgi:hypothetical protein